MSEPMTREEMCEAIKRAGLLLFGPLLPNSVASLARDSREAYDLLASVLAAVEAEKPLAVFVVYGLAGDKDDIKATTCLKDLEAHLSAELLFDEERDAKHEANKAAMDAAERGFDFDSTIVSYKIIILSAEEEAPQS